MYLSSRTLITDIEKERINKKIKKTLKKFSSFYNVQVPLFIRKCSEEDEGIFSLATLSLPFEKNVAV
jgi:ribosome-associated translation inhibitor RaiA